eukprot:11172672-Lingulodinium_polyedra.AAC.1
MHGPGGAGHGLGEGCAGPGRRQCTWLAYGTMETQCSFHCLARAAAEEGCHTSLCDRPPMASAGRCQ